MIKTKPETVSTLHISINIAPEAGEEKHRSLVLELKGALLVDFMSPI